MLTVSGITAEAYNQGSDVVRTALNGTVFPEDVKFKIMDCIGRGITEISGKWGYTGTERPVLNCVITRSEVYQLKTLVSEVDPSFLVMGQAHKTLGEGFSHWIYGNFASFATF